MIQKEGTTRRVFIFKNIVIKVARIHWWGIAKIIKHRLFDEIKWMKKYGSSYFNQKKQWRKNHKTNLIEYEESRLRKEEMMQMKLLPGKRYEIHCTILNCLLSGIMANYHERKFYKQIKNPFAMPTYFSFFGLFNVQKKGERVDFWDLYQIFGYVCDNCQNPNQPFCDGHALASLENYCVDGGKLKLVDYGDQQMLEFLRINGENLYNNFKHPD